MEYDTAGRWVPRYECGFTFFVPGVGPCKVVWIDEEAQKYLCAVSSMTDFYPEKEQWFQENYIEGMQRAEEKSYAARESTAVLPQEAGASCPSCGAPLGVVGGPVRVRPGDDGRGGSHRVGEDDRVGAQQTAQPQGRGSRSWLRASPGLWLTRVLGLAMTVVGVGLVFWALSTPAGPTGVPVVVFIGALGLFAGGTGFVLVMEMPSRKTASSARHNRRR